MTNAHKFVAVHGIEKAKAVLEGAPEGSTHFVGSTYLKLIGAVWWNAWLPEWSHKDNCMVKKWKCESIELMQTWGEVYKLEDLKRLVESVDLVTAWGGLESTYSKFRYAQEHKNTYAANMIQQAIADYELLFCSGESK